MPDGYIRGYRCDRLDAPSVSEAVPPPDTLCHRSHEPERPLRKFLLSRITAFQLRSYSNVGNTISNNSRDKMNRVIQIASLCAESYKWKNPQAGRVYNAKGLSPTILATVIGGGGECRCI